LRCSSAFSMFSSHSRRMSSTGMANSQFSVVRVQGSGG
jgi:hypothetical protein